MFEDHLYQEGHDLGLPDQRRLFSDHPRLLLIRHPFFEVWQAYERVHGDWSARRLVQAIMAEWDQGQHGLGTESVAEWKRRFWWRWPGAPLLIGNLPQPPGPWLFAWLSQQEMPPEETMRQIEDFERRRKATRDRRIHDQHRAIALDARRHIRDVLRGDPLAMKRKWVAVMPRTTKPAPKEAP